MQAKRRLSFLDRYLSACRFRVLAAAGRATAGAGVMPFLNGFRMDTASTALAAGSMAMTQPPFAKARQRQPGPQP